MIAQSRQSRRTFLIGSAAAAAAASMGSPASAQGGSARALDIVYRSISVRGRAARVYGLVDEKGRPGLTFEEGEAFAVRLANKTKEPTLVHWHGMTPPWRQDGVPDVTQPMLQPGASYAYSYPLTRPGTNWMHAHTLQEAQLLAAPLIVRERAAERIDEQEVVVMLHDFSFKSPDEILAGLRGSAGPGGGSGSGSGSGSGNSSGASHGVTSHGAAGHTHGPLHANDIEFDAYLANDRSLDDPEVIRVEAGGRVRLRIINAASATGFHIDLGRLEGEVVAVDGMPVRPVRGSRFPITMAQRLDIRIALPKERTAFPIRAQREDAMEQTGFVLAPQGATVARLSGRQARKAAMLDLSLEARLAARTPLPSRPADRRVEMVLGGDHATYAWTLGLKVGGEPAEVVAVKQGERIEMTMRNDTTMPHPMHLHGHHFQVLAVDGKGFAGALRDTVLVPPGLTVKLAFDADNPGRWMLHCHHLFHMVSGMMTQVVYEGVG